MSDARRALALATIVLWAAGCGGEDAGSSADTVPPERAPASVAGSTTPSWFRIDGDRIAMDIVAGATSDANYWNFNGAAGGAMTITVPVGAQVTINFRNDDPVVTHSIGVGPLSDSPPASPVPQPVFPGAISANPTSMADGTAPGESETLTFLAEQAGEYALLCYIPGHAITGMWVRFNVGGEAGVEGARDVDIMD